MRGETRYRTVVEETVGYLTREMLLSSGGFTSAQDADTDGIEGLTYTWTPGGLGGARARAPLARAVRARPLDRAR